MKKIVIWGATGQSVVLEEFLYLLGYQIVALFDNNSNVKSISDNIPIYYGQKGFNEWKKLQKTEDIYSIIAIGGHRGRDRVHIQTFLENEGLKIITAVHPKAFVAGNADIGKGSQILANSSICARVCLDISCIVNTSSSVDHECNIGNGVHIGPGAKLAGCVTIGDYSFVGIGSTILPRITIGKNTIIGAGSVVTKNMPDNVICYGNPAKIVKTVEPIYSHGDIKKEK